MVEIWRNQAADKSRSAGFQPAVSPISNRQNLAMTVAPGLLRHPQAGALAIQQVWKPALRLAGLCQYPWRNLVARPLITEAAGPDKTWNPRSPRQYGSP